MLSSIDTIVEKFIFVRKPCYKDKIPETNPCSTGFRLVSGLPRLHSECNASDTKE